MEAKRFDCVFAVKDVTETGQFEGHAAVFGNVDRQRDRIKRGAFAQTIEETGGKWPVLMGHDMGRVVGFSTEAKEDNKGLWVAGEFTLASDEGRNAHAVAKHAAGLSQKFGLSIGYGIPDGGADYDAENGVRILKNLVVYEFSMAAVPANPRARMGTVKSAAWTAREFEEHLREAGLSKEAAKLFVLHGYSALGDRREADAGAVIEPDTAFNDVFVAELRQLQFQTQLKELIK